MQETASEIHDHSSPQWPSWWYRATSLTERIVLKQKNTDSHSFHNSHILRNSDRATQRLQRWKEQSPFGEGDYFARRLSLNSLTEEDLLALLDEPIEAMQIDNTALPTWFTELLTAFVDQEAPMDFTWQFSATGQDTQMMAFLTILKPLLSRKLARLQSGIQAIIQHYTSLPFDPKTIVSLLFAHIPVLVFPKLTKLSCLNSMLLACKGVCKVKRQKNAFSPSYSNLVNQRKC